MDTINQISLIIPTRFAWMGVIKSSILLFLTGIDFQTKSFNKNLLETFAYVYQFNWADIFESSVGVKGTST